MKRWIFRIVVVLAVAIPLCCDVTAIWQHPYHECFATRAALVCPKGAH